jgi:protein SCO1/2
MKTYIILLLATGLVCSCRDVNNAVAVTDTNTDSSIAQPATTANKSSAESIFLLPDSFTTQNEKNFVLSSLAGKPTIIAMIFTHCTYACPRITMDMKNIAEKLKANREKVNFVLVSFDADRDTPSQLRKFRNQMELDPSWILLHGSDETVRTLSVLLNVQFEKDAEGNFSHSNLITVLDKNGSVAFQKEGLEADHTETLEKINQLITK